MNTPAHPGTRLLPLLVRGISLLLALCAAPLARAQTTPATYPTWAQSYGVGTYDGTGTAYADNALYSSGFDYPAGLAPMPDGGVVVAGNISYPFEHSGNTEDVEQPTLVRYDAGGSILWQVTLPVPTSATGDGRTAYASCTISDVVTDAQGNIFIAYQAASFTEANGSLPGVAKFGPGGNLLWQTAIGLTVFAMPDGNGGFTYSESGGTGQPGYALNLTADGGVIFGTTDYYAGTSGFTPAFTKLNADGSLALHRPFDQEGIGDIICQSADGSGYVLAIEHGIISNSGTAGLTVLLTDASFAPTAERTFDGESGYLEYATSLQATSDGGYVMSSVGSQRYMPNITTLRKLNADLTPAWEKVFNNFAGATTVLPGGGFLMAGNIELDDSLTGGTTDTAKPAILQLDSTGQLQSAFAFGGMNDDGVGGSYGAIQFSTAQAVQTTDGGIAFTTDSESYFTGPLALPNWWTVKLDPNFRVQDFNGVMTPIPLATFTEHDNAGTNEVTDIAGGIQQYYDHVETTDDALGTPTDPSAYPTPNAPTAAVQADTVTRAVLPLPGALTINTAQPPETGSTWTFIATQAATVSGLTMRVEYSFTPAIESSWIVLPGGGQMTRGTGGNSNTWTLVTTSVPVSTGSNNPNPNLSAAFRVIASASGYDDATDTYSAFYAVGPNTTPVYTGPATLTTAAGDNFSFDALPDFTNGVNQVTPLDPAPPGLSYGGGTDNALTGNPTQAGTYTLRFQGTEPNGNRSGVGTVTLTVEAAPVITSPKTATAQEGKSFTYQIKATDISATSYSAGGLPNGLDYSISTGKISGTLAAGTAGTYAVTLTVSDDNGDSVSATLTLTVEPATPSITSATTATTQAGVAFSYQIAATNNPASFGATGLPSGLSVDAGSGIISGTPASTAVGTKTITLKAINSGGTGEATLTLTIKPATPAITSAATATAQVGTAFTYQITATPAPTSFAATGLPSGLTIDTQKGVISGTPASSAVGTKTITLKATNAGGTGTQTLTLTIKPAAPVITSAVTATAQVGKAFTYTITATGNPSSFGASGLPSGLTIDTQKGIISGTPASSAAGTKTITLKATNAGGTGEKTLTLTIEAVPVITSSLTATATAGQAFSYQITAKNSPASFSASGLPSGLSVKSNGVISGTPASTAVGVKSITLKAMNSAGTGTATLKLTISK